MAVAGVILVFIGTLVLPLPEVLSASGWRSLGLLLLAIVLWLTSIVPTPVTSLIVMALLAITGILPFEQAAAALGKEEIWLILSMLIVGAAFEKYGLDRRIAYRLMIASGGRLRWMLLLLTALAFMLTFFISNAIGRITLLLPIAVGIVAAVGGRGGPHFPKLVFLIITFVPYAGAVSLMTGAGGSIYAVGLFRSMLGYHWDYLYWMVLMMPIVLLSIGVFWLILLWMYPVAKQPVLESLSFFRAEYGKLGPISLSEKKLVFLCLLLAFLWIGGQWHGLPIAVPALAVVCLMFLPGFRLLKWKETGRKVDWGITLLFAAGFALADGLQKNGVIDVMSDMAGNHFNHFSAFALALSMMIIFILIRIGFTNNSAMVASLMPIALTFATASSFNPVWLGMVCLVACSNGYFVPSQSAGSMSTFGFGHYNGKDYFLSGTILTVLMTAITLLAAFLYWPLVGLTIHP